MKPNLETEYDILLKKKLKLEIKALQNTWFKEPKYILALSPIIIALLSFLAVWLSGFFDIQKTKLNNEVFELKSLKDTLENEVSALKIVSNLKRC
jgi:hypothetical protein